MHRKIIKIADKTYVMTLPLAWLSKYNLQKGDELNLQENNNELTITADVNNNKQFISISIGELDDRVIRWLLSALHKSGYDEIELFYNNTQQLQLVGELLKDLFTGFTITGKTDKKLVISAIAEEQQQQFDNSLRRAFRVTLEMAADVAAKLKQQNYDFQQTTKLELLNNQLTNFCQRILNKHRIVEYKKANFLYVILWNLEKICDNYKYICNHFENQEINNKLISPEIISLFDKVNSFFLLYYDLYYNFSLQKLTSISKQHKVIKTEITSFQAENISELFMLNICSQILTQTADFSSSIIALNQLSH
ncbi:AbrB/MazE/SpoVT family DNA-binding domain-containing protein [Candidatus Woesearchaeota archaeon]|nr:AbrB/MazE/SpoVT family DNA-binding domain-containing protein [Candidatus Woesearchaeota archaeon]